MCRRTLTLEEVRFDFVLVYSNPEQDLHVRVDGVRQSRPVGRNHQRISKPCPILPVLVHPVMVAPEEVRIVDVFWVLSRRTRLHPQPVEDKVKCPTADSVDLQTTTS
ncbi:hypothetical protein NP493_58g01000 [Ridgeia piscesae]|uniref:Uncharacterized protein n=1 Tax=Ridgeia piscesae TaxID=27915 RepID=A0AAD9PAU6_RIDPI|nr:hypothetical protein NP493_58g01000 [Ridgeia piscesae]